MPTKSTSSRIFLIHPLCPVEFMLCAVSNVAHNTVLELTDIALHLPQLPQSLDSLVVVNFSDLHAHRSRSKERIIAELIQQGSDLITCSGDSCWDHWFGQYAAPDVNAAAAVFQHLLSRPNHTPPIYAVQGNHDP